IYPEWYFLWSYEILRPFSVDIGLVAFAFAQVIFVLLPWLDRSPNTVPANRRGLFAIWFWVMLVNLIVLTAMGKLPPEGMFSQIGFVSAILFIVQWLMLPFITMFEKKV
ncbi:MAG: cytochrome bc complex cytochrome b subunit, partial [Sulfurimonas sp.]